MRIFYKLAVLRLLKQLSFVRVLVTLLTLLTLTACSTVTDPAETFKGETQKNIFNHGEQSLLNSHYKDAIKRFEALEVQYPYSSDIERAELHVIYAHYMLDEYPEAQSAAERYIHAWPANPHVVYAYYMRALSYYHQNLGVFERVFPVDLSRRDLEPMHQAWMDFAVVARQFPNSEYAPAANQYMIYLRNMMAQHELDVAMFYFRHRAFVAASNRASDVIRHYQGAPAVKPALTLLANAYHALHARDSEREVLQVIWHNYPKESILLIPSSPMSVDNVYLDQRLGG